MSTNTSQRLRALDGLRDCTIAMMKRRSEHEKAKEKLAAITKALTEASEDLERASKSLESANAAFADAKNRMDIFREDRERAMAAVREMVKSILSLNLDADDGAPGELAANADDAGAAAVSVPQDARSDEASSDRSAGDVSDVVQPEQPEQPEPVAADAPAGAFPGSRILGGRRMQRGAGKAGTGGGDAVSPVEAAPPADVFADGTAPSSDVSTNSSL